MGENNTPDDAEDNEDPIEATSEQDEWEDGQVSPDEQAIEEDSEDGSYHPLSEEEVSLGNEDFIVPEAPLEQERFKRQLIATARSLKKKKQQLQAHQDLLTDRWTEVLAAEEYGLERHTADRPPRGRDKTAYQPEYQPASPRQFTTSQGNTKDLQDRLEHNAGQPRLIYGSRGRATTHDDDRHTR